jgi:hypothetical protein
MRPMTKVLFSALFLLALGSGLGLGEMITNFLRGPTATRSVAGTIPEGR